MSLTEHEAREIEAVRPRKQVHDEFWRHVDLSEVGPWDCWEWTAMKRRGYGRFNTSRKEPNRRVVQAHRHAYFLTYGPFTEPVIRHRCDNKGCVNPMHLIAGTKGDNLREAYERGQKKPTAGASNGNAKLTEEQAAEIMLDERPYKTVAAEYGVHHETVARIRRGEKWPRLRAALERRRKEQGK